MALFKAGFFFRVSCASLAICLGAVCARAQPPAPEVLHSMDPGLADLVRLFRADWQDVSRFYGVPWSEVRAEKQLALLTQWERRLAEVNFDSLKQQGRIDYILLRDEFELRRSRLELERKRLVEMTPLLPFRSDIQGLELSRRKLEEADAKAAAGKLATIPDSVKKLRERIEKGRKETKKSEGGDSAHEGEDSSADDGPLKVTAVVAQRAASVTDDLRRALSQWASYHEGFQPDFAWWTKQPREAADKALVEYARFLRETVAGINNKPEDPLIGDPIGEQSLLADLRAEKVAYTPTELIEIGNRQFAWCEAEMRKASAEMGFGDDWKTALARVKENHVPPGEQAKYVRDLSREAIAFVKEKDLLTVPALCEELWRIEMHSPETQRTLPFAVYGGLYMGVSYPTDAMPHEDKAMSMRGNNRHFTRLVTPHELIPGHHLQGFYADRYRDYRQMFSTPFFVEGWALYWEFRFWDLGWAKSPEDRIGMLFWRMHRCARIIVSLKFHLGEMKPSEMIDFLVDRVGHERMGATSEVRRYIGGLYSPLYQCGYMIGGLQVMALHRELVGSGRMTEKKFNDTLLTYGSIPVELIRAGMTDAPLKRDWRASWRFAEP